MYGVVLWRDKADKKAVIWCEDHGDLAFYDASTQSNVEDICDPMPDQTDNFFLDVGDFVQFELREDRHLRYVVSPKLIAEDEYPTLALGLNTIMGAQNNGADCNKVNETNGLAKIIQLKTCENRHRNAPKSTFPVV